jgi:hypothetical protein
MTKVARVAAMLAAGILAAQPGVAADFQDFQATHREVSAFAGVNVRLPIGHSQRARPTARLQLTTSHTVRDARTGAAQTFRAGGLEFGAARGGKPSLYLNGQNTDDLQRRLNASGTGKTLLIVGGVVLVLVVVASVLAAPASLLDPCDGPSDLCDG